MLESVAVAIGKSFTPLQAALRQPSMFTALLRGMGYHIQLTSQQFSTVQNVLALQATLDSLIGLIDDIQNSNGSNTGTLVAQVLTLADDLFTAIKNLSGTTAAEISDLPAPLDTTDFWTGFAVNLPTYLLSQHLAARAPAVNALLNLSGVMSTPDAPAEPAQTSIDWQALPALLTDPLGQIAGTYGWGGPFEHKMLLERLAQLFASTGMDVRKTPAPASLIQVFFAEDAAPPDLEALEVRMFNSWLNGAGWLQLGFMMMPVPKVPNGPITGLYLANLFSGTVTDPIDEPTLSASGNLPTSDSVGILVHPNTPARFEHLPPEIELELSWRAMPDDPIVLLGSEDGTRFEMDGVEFTVAIQGTAANPELIVRLKTTGEGLKVIIAPGEGDAFVKELLGTDALTVGTEIIIEWSSKTGFRIAGGLALDLTIPLNLKLLVVTILELHLSLGVSTDGVIEAQADVDANALLGPFTLTVSDIGARATLAPGDDPTASGTFGGLEVAWAFKPPGGAGVGFDFLGIVYGGGFIDHDPDIGRYSGMITVEILAIGITATVIITSQLPGDPTGWSLFISMNVNLGGIPLGFGFTLEKIGGLIGIHRSIDTAALQSGIRTGMLDSLLFPDDPIANAPRILSDIEAAFPTARGSFVVGAMLQIGWGTPTIVTADLGLIIQLPDVIIALIGQAETILPHDDVALIEIHFDVLGILDLTAGTLAIDAGLRDSRIVGFVLTGQMALRANFLDDPSFLLSMGGFHPAFIAPEGFPTLDRMSFGLSVGSWLNISLQAYLALTSNTVQFGAGLYLTASLIGFKVEGGVEINTLIQFKPFQFRTDLRFYITISAASIELMGVLLTGHISGPNPYYVRGTAQFKLLGLKKEVDIEETIGDRSAIDDADDVPVLADVITAFEDLESWRAVDEGARMGAVLLADSDEGAVTAVHPAGSVEVVQRVAPLDVELEHYGNAGISGEDTLRITQVQVGGADLEWEFVEDWFAPAQFFELANDEKLSAPSFEKMKGGLRLGDDKADGGSTADTVYDYKQITYDPEFESSGSRRSETYRPDTLSLNAVQAQVVTHDRARHPVVGKRTAQVYQLQAARYVVVDRETLTNALKKTTRVMTYAEANQTMRSRGRTTDVVVTSSERQPS